MSHRRAKFTQVPKPLAAEFAPDGRIFTRDTLVKSQRLNANIMRIAASKTTTHRYSSSVDEYSFTTSTKVPLRPVTLPRVFGKREEDSSWSEPRRAPVSLFFPFISMEKLRKNARRSSERNKARRAKRASDYGYHALLRFYILPLLLQFYSRRGSIYILPWCLLRSPQRYELLPLL